MASTNSPSTASTKAPPTALGITTAISATASSASPSLTIIKSTSMPSNPATVESDPVIEAPSSIYLAEQESNTINDTPPDSSAADKVFGNAELTENIFENLSMKDLLVSQRICRGARATVEQTPRFQRRLFLEPGSLDDVHEDKPADDTRYVTEMVANPDEWMEKVPDEIDTWKIVFNPLFVEECLNISGRSPLRFKAMPRITAKFLRDDLVSTSSCRQMYLTQPPLQVKTTSISINSKACNGCHVGVHFLEEWSEGEKLGGGTTLGELIDHLKASVVKECRNMKARSDEDSNWTFGLGEQEPDAEAELEEEEESWINSVD